MAALLGQFRNTTSCEGAWSMKGDGWKYSTELSPKDDPTQPPPRKRKKGKKPVIAECEVCISCRNPESLCQCEVYVGGVVRKPVNSTK